MAVRGRRRSTGMVLETALAGSHCLLIGTRCPSAAQLREVSLMVPVGWLDLPRPIWRMSQPIDTLRPDRCIFCGRHHLHRPPLKMSRHHHHS